jgi:N utilization substance protein B
MAHRHLSRSIVLQSLFEWDFMKLPLPTVEAALERNALEFAPGLGDQPFMLKLLRTTIEKASEIDAIIEKAAPDWPLDKIANVDRQILRIGLAELLFADRVEVPAKVAINEAIELAKSFGGETSGRFVNGVLGAVYKEMGEPGKDDGAPRRKKDVPFEEMMVETKVGALIYARKKKELSFGLVHDVFGYWTLSKGGMKEGESVEDAIKRVILEEMGLTVTRVREKLGENEYVANHPEKGRHRKQVSYYLAEAEHDPIVLGKDKGGLDDGRWFAPAEVANLNFYNDIVPLITKAVGILAADEK